MVSINQQTSVVVLAAAVIVLVGFGTSFLVPVDSPGEGATPDHQLPDCSAEARRDWWSFIEFTERGHLASTVARHAVAAKGWREEDFSVRRLADGYVTQVPEGMATYEVLHCLMFEGPARMGGSDYDLIVVVDPNSRQVVQVLTSQ